MNHTMNEVMKIKKSYMPPQLEVFEYEVEHGFAVSMIVPKAYNNEEVNEITDATGQNYHGEWF